MTINLTKLKVMMCLIRYSATRLYFLLLWHLQECLGALFISVFCLLAYIAVVYIVHTINKNHRFLFTVFKCLLLVVFTFEAVQMVQK